jgi:hypothetical protein
VSNFDYKVDISITLKTAYKLADTRYNRDKLILELNDIERELVDRIQEEIRKLKMQVMQGGRMPQSKIPEWDALLTYQDGDKVMYNGVEVIMGNTTGVISGEKD